MRLLEDMPGDSPSAVLVERLRERVFAAGPVLATFALGVTLGPVAALADEGG